MIADLVMIVPTAMEPIAPEAPKNRLFVRTCSERRLRRCLFSKKVSCDPARGLAVALRKLILP